ncbi:MAG: hypothetical protein WA532_14085 [Candidatus Korobacteraceae bacterium]
MTRPLPILAVLLLLPVFAYPQSLGDVARESRAEKLNSAVPPAKVFTNDDIAKLAAHVPAPNVAPESNPAASAEETYKPANTGTRTDTQELETQRRTDEINTYYLNRIDGLRDQMNAAQLELGRLEGDRLDVYNDSTNAYSPNVAQDEVLMSSLTDQIEAQRTLIANLKAQLKEMREEARHAGVRHPTAGAAYLGNSDEIDKHYLDRIAILRSQLVNAKQELAQLQRQTGTGLDGFETIPTVPIWPPDFNEEIKERRDLVASLHAQLEETQEAARHAGVRHATN